VASSASRRGNRRSNFCLSLAAPGPLCGCVTIICLLRALMRTIGNGRFAACRSSRPLRKGATQAGFASAVRGDRGVRSRRGDNLAVAVCLMARDRKGPMIQCQVLVNPALDLTRVPGLYRQCPDDYLR